MSAPAANRDPLTPLSLLARTLRVFPGKTAVASSAVSDMFVATISLRWARYSARSFSMSASESVVVAAEADVVWLTWRAESWAVADFGTVRRVPAASTRAPWIQRVIWSS